MNWHRLFFTVMLAVFLFSTAAIAADAAASGGINVFEDQAFKDATADLTPDGRNLAAAELYIRIRQYDRAIPLLKQLTKNHNAAELWNLLAFSYNRVGSWKEAYDASNASIMLKPGIPFCYGERGIAAYQLGNFGEAEKDIAKYLKTKGADGIAHYYHGLALARMGRLTAARGSFVLARLHKPLLAAFTDYNIALIDAGNGHVREALKPMKEIYAAFKDDNNQFSLGLEKDIARLQNAEVALQHSRAVRDSVLDADARNAASHFPKPAAKN